MIGEKQKKLRIVFLDFDDIRNPLLGAGQSKATLEVGKRLAANGHEVISVCSRYPGFRDRIEHGINYRHIGLGSRNLKLNNLIYIFCVPWTVRSIRADVIVECFTAPVSTLFSPLWTSVPVVALSTSFEAERFSRIYHLPFDRVQNLGLRFYRYFIAYTDYIDEKMRVRNPQIFSRIIPLGVDGDFFRIKQEDPKHILYLGRLDVGQKGIDLLLKAYAKVKEKIGYPLVIAGHGPDEEKVKMMVRQLGLQGKVFMPGATYGGDKERVLSESLYAAIPSRDETFCLFALEALAAGLPVVSFDIPGIAWVSKDVSLKARMFDVNQYAEMLLKAADSQIAERLRRRSRNFAESFTWDKTAAKFENFLGEILDREKGIFTSHQIY